LDDIQFKERSSPLEKIDVETRDSLALAEKQCITGSESEFLGLTFETGVGTGTGMCFVGLFPEGAAAEYADFGGHMIDDAIEFGYFLKKNNLRISEQGRSLRMTVTEECQTGDQISIMLNDSMRIEYMRNGQTVHTSIRDVTFPLYTKVLGIKDHDDQVGLGVRNLQWLVAGPKLVVTLKPTSSITASATSTVDVVRYLMTIWLGVLDQCRPINVQSRALRPPISTVWWQVLPLVLGYFCVCVATRFSSGEHSPLPKPLLLVLLLLLLPPVLLLSADAHALTQLNQLPLSWLNQRRCLHALLQTKGARAARAF